MQSQPFAQPAPLAIHLKPLPLEDPELADLKEPRIAAIVHRLWTEYDWHIKVRAREYRNEVVQEMSRFVTTEHPVLKEWSWLSKATNKEYATHYKQWRRRELWERKFREAKTTQQRERAVHWLMQLTTQHHPYIQLYLNRSRDPRSRKGWWELEPSTTRRGTTSTRPSASSV